MNLPSSPYDFDKCSMTHNDKENMGCGGVGAPVSGAPDADVLPFSQPISSPSKVGIKCLFYMIVYRNFSYIQLCL